jgi:hypothetical protein
LTRASRAYARASNFPPGWVFDVRSGADAGRRLGDRGEMSAEGGLVRGGRRGRWIAVAALCGSMLALSAAPARAATSVIDGTPLNIYVDDGGRLQVAFDGSATGEFLPTALAPASAGINIATGPTNNPPIPFVVYGFAGSTPFTGGGAPTLTGDGSAGNPWVLRALFLGTSQNGPDVLVTETVSYVNGSTDVDVQYTLDSFQTNDGVPFRARVYEAANLAVAGNDAGLGVFDPGPPRQVGGVNPDPGGTVRLIEATPWDRFQEGPSNQIFAVVANTDQTATGFSNTVNAPLAENGVGVQRDFPSIDDGAPGSFSVTWRFKHFTPLQLTLLAATRATGQTATVTVAARNGDGNPDPGRPVRYSIAGANPSAGAVTTGADGTALITWAGTKVGTDTLAAFTDVNANGVQDADEPRQTAVVTWTPPPPPVPGKSVVVKVVSGQVFIKYPPGYVPRATGPAKGFVPFVGSANIPVGSQLDTRKGRVALTSAADTGARKVQTADFYQGIFQVKQAVPKTTRKKPTALTTDLVMKGQIARSQCAPLKGASAAQARKKKKGPKAVLGKLWGSGKGKFRTKGKYSAATVRGTIWLVEDRCEGTFTKVVRGTVQVRDVRRKRTVTIKAGHTYLARALRAATKSRR